MSIETISALFANDDLVAGREVDGKNFLEYWYELYQKSKHYALVPDAIIEMLMQKFVLIQTLSNRIFFYK